MSDDLDESDESCESCGATDDVSEDPNGEFLCPDCADESWFN